MSLYFADQSWPQLQEAIENKALILLPVGTIEEHGRHLPVSTDAVIATEVARGLAEALQGELPVLVIPTIWTGYSTKDMARWPGTMRVRTRVLMDLIFDVCASLIEMGFQKIIMLDCHGHHDNVLKTVTREIADAYEVYLAVISPAALSAERYREIRKSEIGGSIHGGEWETSLMLYFNQPVDMSQATNQDIMRYHSEFIPGDNFVGKKGVFWSTWGLQRSQTGIYGDPTVATKETGQAIMEAIIENGVRFAREFYAFQGAERG